jgi:predicted RNase H-like HicB family nuclease
MTAPSAAANIESLYPYRVEPDEEGGYVIVYPDLPGCMTQVEDAAEIGPMAEEIRELWLETAKAHSMTIPPASPTPSYSGKLVVKVPRTLHRDLAESAAREKVSLDEYVAMLLARRDSMARVEQRLVELAQGGSSAESTPDFIAKPTPSQRRTA